MFPFALIQYLRTPGLPSRRSARRPSATASDLGLTFHREAVREAREKQRDTEPDSSVTIHIFVSLSEVPCTPALYSVFPSRIAVFESVTVAHNEDDTISLGAEEMGETERSQREAPASKGIANSS